MITSSPEETGQAGAQLGRELPPNAIVCLYGDLAAGKTTFAKGLISSLVNIAEAAVQSPTFTYLQTYRGDTEVHHFDLYRIRDAAEFQAMGFDEVFDEAGITCIEWPERISSLLPASRVDVHIRTIGEHSREIEWAVAS